MSLVYNTSTLRRSFAISIAWVFGKVPTLDSGGILFKDLPFLSALWAIRLYRSAVSSLRADAT